MSQTSWTHKKNSQKKILSFAALNHHFTSAPLLWYYLFMLVFFELCAKSIFRRSLCSVLCAVSEKKNRIFFSCSKVSRKHFPSSLTQTHTTQPKKKRHHEFESRSKTLISLHIYSFYIHTYYIEYRETQHNSLNAINVSKRLSIFFCRF